MAVAPVAALLTVATVSVSLSGSESAVPSVRRLPVGLVADVLLFTPPASTAVAKFVLALGALLTPLTLMVMVSGDASKFTPLLAVPPSSLT